MARKLVTYERGTTYVSNIVSGSTPCYGLVGTLWIGGLAFDTLERFELDLKTKDYVHLPKGDYLRAVMYWHSGKKRVIHPWAGKAPSQKQENILIHAGTKPSHFEGCLGVGFLEKAGSAQELRYDKESLELIWEQAGGVPGKQEGWNASSPIVLFKVLNAFPDRKALRPHSG